MSISAANREWKNEGEKRREKQEQSRNLPSRFQGFRVKVMTVYIDRGNILSTGQNGIKWAGSFITSFPSAYDANTMTSFIDGVGRGVLAIDGVVQDGYVLVLNDMGSGISNALIGDGFDRCSVLGPVSIQVGASADYVTAYRVG